MNWIRDIRFRFENSPAEIHGRWVCEAGKTKCELDFRSVPGHSLIFNVDILDTVDEQIHEAIFGQSRCDYVAIGRDCANPYLLLIEVKGDKHPKPRRILRAKRQIKNSEAIVLTMMRDCHGIPLGLNVQHVVITRRIPASTMSRWQKLPSGENPFRGITLVFSGDDIWRTIYNT